MGAFENFEQLKTTLADCIDENERIWKTPYEPSDKEQIIYRLNFYYDHIKDLEEVAGDLIEFCKDFVEENIHLGCEEYLKNTDKTMNEISAGKDRRTLWHNCFALFPHCAKDVKKYESDRRLDKYIGELKCGEVWLKIEESNKCWQIPNPYGKYDALYAYCKLRKHFEYNVLSRLYDYLNNKSGNSFVVDKEQLVILTRALCLYIAMRNERKQVLKDAKYARLNLEELQTATPATQGKRTKPESSETELPTELDTEEGRELLQKVINAGFCDENYNWDETKWRDGEDVLALVCFAYKANKKLDLIRKQGRKEIISWKPFDTLFTYRTKLNKESGKTQLQITRTNYMQSKNYTAFIIPNHIERKLAPLFDKH